MPKIQNFVGQLPHGALVVKPDRDTRICCIKRPGDHIGNAPPFQKFIAISRPVIADEQKRIGPAGHKVADLLFLHFTAVRRTGHKQRNTLFSKAFLKGLQPIGKDRVFQRRHNRAKGIRAFGCQCLCPKIRRITQLFDRLHHLFSGGLRHLRRGIQTARNGRR